MSGMSGEPEKQIGDGTNEEIEIAKPFLNTPHKRENRRSAFQP